MAEVVQRFLDLSHILDAASILTRSSAQLSLPISSLLDGSRSKVWRTDIGWTIITGFNDGIPLNEATTGDAIATIPAGLYITGAAVAAAAGTALTAAATDNSYVVTYDIATGKFTTAILSGSTAFSLEWSTGSIVNAGKQGSAGPDLGYDDSADTASNTSAKVGDNPSYQSRHWVVADLGSAKAATAAGLVNHNVSATGVVRRQLNATNVWTAPTTNQVNWLQDSGPASPGLATIATIYAVFPTLQWVRILVDDVQNTDGFFELGAFFWGTYVEPDQSMQHGSAETLGNVSPVDVAHDGAMFQERRNEAFAFTGKFDRVNRATRDSFRALEARLGVGGKFLFALDPGNFPASETYYGAMTRALQGLEQLADGNPPSRFNVALVFQESLS